MVTLLNIIETLCNNVAIKQYNNLTIPATGYQQISYTTHACVCALEKKISVKIAICQDRSFVISWIKRVKQ